MNEHIQFIPNFRMYKIWNATRKCWMGNPYSQRGHALNFADRFKRDQLIILVTIQSEKETIYEII